MIIEKVIHGKYFFYEDTISGKVLKAVYKDYGTMFSTLVVYEISEKKKWNIFGFKFGFVNKFQLKSICEKFSISRSYLLVERGTDTCFFVLQLRSPESTY